MATNLIGTSASSKIAGVKGENTDIGGYAVWGITDAGHGVHGESTTGDGVVGESRDYRGVYGKSQGNAGVVGESDNLHGVFGICHNPNGGGVYGTNSTGGHGIEGDGQTAGRGVWGHGQNGQGVVGESVEGEGVFGHSVNKAAVMGVSVNSEGVHAESNSKGMAAVAAFQNNPLSTGAALYAEHKGANHTAAFFKGNVVVTGDITLANADCAEDFDIATDSAAEPGTVMVLDNESSLRASSRPYDKRVAGVVSGAGNYKPGLVLDKQAAQANRKPIALLGKVFCKVDAQFGSIEVGDLLTTSSTAGHAMRVDDPLKAFGTVIGKALRPLADGQGLIPILIALQ